MATITVGPGKQHATIAAAVKAAAAGDTILVDAGTYNNDWTYISKSLTLRAASGVVKMTASQPCPNGKGIIWGGLANNTTVNIVAFDISGAKVADRNGAGIRYEGGNLNLQNCRLHHCENGILANRDPSGTIALTHCEVDHCGYGDGQTHGVYVNQIANLTITDCYFHETSVGHEIKSRAVSTTIRRTRVYDLDATASYCIDMPNGGTCLVEDCTVQQGAKSQNPYSVTWGVEGATNQQGAAVFRRNTFVNDRAGTTLLFNRTSTEISFVDNRVFGSNAQQLGSPLKASGTVFLPTRPVLDTNPIDLTGEAPPPTEQPPVVDPPPVIDPPPEVTPEPPDPPVVSGTQAAVPTWDAFAALEHRVAALEAAR